MAILVCWLTESRHSSRATKERELCDSEDNMLTIVVPIEYAPVINEGKIMEMPTP